MGQGVIKVMSWDWEAGANQGTIMGLLSQQVIEVMLWDYWTKR